MRGTIRIMQVRILIISNDEFKLKNECKYLIYNILNSPSKECLENAILNSDYNFIIPLTSVITYNRYENINILKLLNNYEINYFGNSYLKYLIVNEKNAFIMQTGLNIKSEIWTYYNYLKQIELLSDSDFPILIEDNCNDSHIAFSIVELDNTINSLSSNKNNEVTVYKNYSFEKIYNTIVAGNMPNVVFAASESNSNEYSFLKEKSIELFSKLNFKNFVSFKFAKRDEKYFLLNVNPDNLLDNETIEVFNYCYQLNIEQIVNLYILIFCVNNFDENYISVVKYLYETLPNKITSALVPFNIKKICGINYDYNDICNTLKRRFLSSDESNKYEFIKIIESCIENTPKRELKSYCLGDNNFDYDDFLSFFEKVPQNPQNQNDVLKKSLQILNGQIKWHSPLTFYNVCPPTMMNTVAASTITNIYNPNGMIDKTSGGYLFMEKQIVRQLSNLLDIDAEKSAGVFTSGGKVCITYAVKSGLNRCQRNFKSNKSPIIITSQANHYSIEDVGFQLGIKECVRIPLKESLEMDYIKFEKCIESCLKNETPIACIIISGGNTMHSVVEDINKIKKIINYYVDKFDVTYTPYIYYDMVVCWPWLFYKSYDFYNNPLKLENSIIDKIKNISDIFRNTNLADGFGFDFHKGGFSPYVTSLFISKLKCELYSINSPLGEIRRDSNYHTFTNSRSTTGIISAWNVLQSVGVQGFQAYIANMLAVIDVIVNVFETSGIKILKENNTFGFTILTWIKSPKISQSFSTVLKHKRLIKENNNYIYKFTEYLKKNGNINICVRYLPKYIYEGNLISVMSFLPMTMNLNKENANEIANIILEIKSDFDEKYMIEKNFNFDKAPENVPR